VLNGYSRSPQTRPYNTNNAFRLFDPVYDMNTYTSKVGVVPKLAEYESNTVSVFVAPRIQHIDANPSRSQTVFRSHEPLGNRLVC